MPDYDEILQDHLSKLERGEPVDEVLRDLEGEIKILEPLIRLAVAVREVPHPEPIADTVQMQRSKIRDAILASAEKKTIPFHAVPNTRPAPRKQNYWAWLGGATLFAAAGAAVVMILMLASAFGLWQSVRSRQTARVETIVGQAQIATNKAGTDWKNLEEGDRISAGQRLRTLGGIVCPAFVL